MPTLRTESPCGDTRYVRVPKKQLLQLRQGLLQRDDLDEGACCLTKECSRADCSLPHSNVPHAHAGARADDGTGSSLGDPALPNTSARAISPRQTFRRRWTVRSRWSG